MPPKKTKPNEKCHCGSGKKHKKCCMIAEQLAASRTAAAAPPPPAAATNPVLNEVMVALSLTADAISGIATTTAVAASDSIDTCLHGSTSDHFSDGRPYNDLIRDYLAVYKEDGWREKFVDNHEEYFRDLHFGEHIFAVCTSWYLKINTTNSDMKDLLVMGMYSKYHDPDEEKVKRHVRTIMRMDDVGVMYCLSQETKSYCGCMEARKTMEELMDALSLTITTADTRLCSHGSTSEHFSDGLAYKGVIHNYLLADLEGWGGKFIADYQEQFRDLNFIRYTFALCTSWYLRDLQNANMSQYPFELPVLLDLAVQFKYFHTPLLAQQRSDGPGPDHDQLKRYLRDCSKNGERGVINCLSRETKLYCNCMQDKKMEAESMTKVHVCTGCDHTFPREGMKRCRGCKFAMFCTKGCYKASWPNPVNHREVCKEIQTSKTVVRELVQDEEL